MEPDRSSQRVTKAQALQLKLIENKAKVTDLVNSIEGANAALNNMRGDLERVVEQTQEAEKTVDAYVRAGERELKLAKALTRHMHSFYMSRLLPSLVGTDNLPQFVFESDLTPPSQSAQQQGYGVPTATVAPSFPPARPPYPSHPTLPTNSGPPTLPLPLPSQYGVPNASSMSSTSSSAPKEPVLTAKLHEVVKRLKSPDVEQLKVTETDAFLFYVCVK